MDERRQTGAGGEPSWTVYAGLLAATFFWGANFIVGKYALVGLPPITVTAGRVIIGAAGALLWLRLSAGGCPPLRRRDLPLFTALALSGAFAFNVLYFFGLRYGTATEGSLVMAANPVITAALATLLLREALTLRRVGALALSFVGVAVIVTASPAGGDDPNNRALGIAIFVAAAASWALYSVLMRLALRSHAALACTAYSLALGLFFVIPASVWELATGDGIDTLSRAPLLSWLAVLYAGLMATVLSFLYWNRGVESLGATRASLFMNVVPIWAALLGVLVLGEQITLAHAAGGIVVLAAVFLANLGNNHVQRATAPRRARL